MRAREFFGGGVLSSKKLASTSQSLGMLLLLLVLSSFALPQEGGAVKPRSGEQDPIRVSVDLVVLHATVRGHGGNFVRGLTKEDFQVYEDGVLQPISAFSAEDIPVTVGLVVDNSGSMIPKVGEVIAAALAFARSSNPQDQMFVVHFNENISFGLPAKMAFTDNETQLRVAMARINANGMTALYDAVAVALEHLKKGNRDKKVLIVLSDGADNASKHNLAELMAMAAKSDAIIYTMGLYEEGDPDRNPSVLKKLAKATGGEAFMPETLKEVVPMCERIAREIRNQYTLAYVSTNRKQDGTYRGIQVNASTPKSGARLLVRTRAGYYAPLKPPPPGANETRP